MIGIPATLVYDVTGTIGSPWPPSTKPVTSRTDTPSSQARKVRKRAESSTPAMPITRSRGSLASANATWHMASSGLVTTIRIVLGRA